MRLYLCRHGEAIDRSEDRDDADRWLTADGRREVAKVGRALREMEDVPDLILTSPLVRAVQTADELAWATGYREAVEVLPALAPGGALADVLAALGSLKGTGRSVFLVGHEPQMSEWTARLVGRRSFDRRFQKGGVARVNWKGAAEMGTGKPGFYLSPRQKKPEPF